MKQWIIGLGFSLIVGQIVVDLFLKFHRRPLGLPKKPMHGSGKRVHDWLMGSVERLFFTLLVGFDQTGFATAMIAWLGVKLAANWIHPDWAKPPDARTIALVASMGGLVSLLFALIGGKICAHKLTLGGLNRNRRGCADARQVSRAASPGYNSIVQTRRDEYAETFKWHLR